MILRQLSSTLISLNQALVSIMSTMNSWLLSPWPAPVMLIKCHSICFNLSQGSGRVMSLVDSASKLSHLPLSSLTGKTWNVTSSPFPLYHSRPGWAHLRMALSHTTASKQVELTPHSICSKSSSFTADPIAPFWGALQSPIFFPLPKYIRLTRCPGKL